MRNKGIKNLNFVWLKKMGILEKTKIFKNLSPRYEINSFKVNPKNVIFQTEC